MNKVFRNIAYNRSLKVVSLGNGNYGLYTRLSQNLASLTEEEKQQLETELNSKPPFKDPVDVILFIES